MWHVKIVFSMIKISDTITIVAFPTSNPSHWRIIIIEFWTIGSPTMLDMLIFRIHNILFTDNLLCKGIKLFFLKNLFEIQKWHTRAIFASRWAWHSLALPSFKGLKYGCLKAFLAQVTVATLELESLIHITYHAFIHLWNWWWNPLLAFEHSLFNDFALQFK